MKKTRTTTFHKNILRRTTACVLSLIGLWMLSFAIPSTSHLHWLKLWGGNAQFVTAALAAQLSMTPAEQDAVPSSRAQKLLLSESALLSGFTQTKESTPAPKPEPEPTKETEPDDSEDKEKVSTTSPDHIVEQFFKPTSTNAYACVDDVYILNRTSKALDMAALATTPVEIALPQDENPQILIMHTHGSEAYAQDGLDIYNETGTARTTDPNYNIIRVGDEIERIFKEMGLNVLHDRSLCDYPSYNGAYDRSKAVVKQYLSDYPSIKIVLDIHRDALVGKDGTIYKPVTEIDGVKTAQVLLVMGSDDGGLSHPNWQQNLSLAMRVQHRMNTLWPGVARPITLRSARFNQQLTAGSLLVEVGAHGNTLQEALSAARLFARSAGQVFLELKE